ncbi:MAG TPA: acyltransferase [Fibrobacteria bacterium]|nr:acyltransferase [Fibrobacteria bacterium]
MSNRDNNLNLVRFVAAFSVTISHAFVLSSGRLYDEPMRATMGMSLGDIAVDVFFTISGFLVVGSLVRKRDRLGFLQARVMRIFPALIAMVAGCVLFVGPVFGKLPPVEFLTHRSTWGFVVRNLTLVKSVGLGLPGVFTKLPWPGIVNGSLWTLVYEIRLYICLAAIWWLVKLLGVVDEVRAIRWICAAIVAAAWAWQIALLVSPLRDSHGLVDPVPRLVLMFYSGACWRLLGGRIPLDGRIVAAFLVLTPLLLVLGKTAFLLGYLIALPYLVWWVSFVPEGAIRAFNRWGDASYGIYIYSFPIQQVLVQSITGIRPPLLIVLGGAIIVTLGFLSWHLLEKRFLPTSAAASK